jgi:hypothetical protein
MSLNVPKANMLPTLGKFCPGFQWDLESRRRALGNPLPQGTWASGKLKKGRLWFTETHKDLRALGFSLNLQSMQM